MGRAKTQTRAVATGSFNAILGRNRGSAAAQAQRDASERAQEEAEFASARERQKLGLESFRIQVVVAIPGKTSGQRPDTYFTDALTDAYFDQDEAETTAIILKMIRARENSERAEAFRELGVALKVGDPLSCPGLTAPVQQALCEYLCEDGMADPIFGQLYAEVTLKWLFGHGRLHPDIYHRCQPLFESAAPFLCNKAEPNSSALRTLVVELLRRAPEDALGGPLRSWVEGLATAVKKGYVSSTVKRELKDLLGEFDAGSKGAIALVPIVDQLYPRLRPRPQRRFGFKVR
jgi:hypothetical protein